MYKSHPLLSTFALKNGRNFFQHFLLKSNAHLSPIYVTLFVDDIAYK